MSETQRNLLILLAIAVVGVTFSSQYGAGSGIIKLLLNVAFTVMMVWFGVVLYRRNSGTIAQMPAAPRLLLQASVIVLLGAWFTGQLALPGLLPMPPFGWASYFPVPFWSLILVSGFGIWYAWQQRSSRW